jgi:hypothetical protein
MKRLSTLALLVLLGAGTAQVHAGCPGCGGGIDTGGWGWGLGGFDAWTFIDREPNRANIYPDGPITAFAGEWATGFQAHSNYSPINWYLPPAANAQAVLDKLKEMNIPLVSPEPMFLGKNPRIAENVKLPTPRMKKAKDE